MRTNRVNGRRSDRVARVCTLTDLMLIQNVNTAIKNIRRARSHVASMSCVWASVFALVWSKVRLSWSSANRISFVLVCLITCRHPKCCHPTSEHHTKTLNWVNLNRTKPYESYQSCVYILIFSFLYRFSVFITTFRFETLVKSSAKRKRSNFHLSMVSFSNEFFLKSLTGRKNTLLFYQNHIMLSKPLAAAIVLDMVDMLFSLCVRIFSSSSISSNEVMLPFFERALYE